MVEEKISCLMQEFWDDKISKEQLIKQGKQKFTSHEILKGLKISLRHKDARLVENTILLGFMLDYFDNSFGDVLCNLIIAEFHREHENIIGVLKDIKYDLCVNNVIKAMHMKFEYFDDDGEEFIRKSSYLLNSLKTEESKKVLRELSLSSNEFIKKYSLYQVNRWSDG